MNTQTPKTLGIAIVCPDCKHPILWDGRTWHDGEDIGCSKSGCNCELDQNQALAKWIEQDRAETRRAALLEACRKVCPLCENGVRLEKSVTYFHVANFVTWECHASPIHVILAKSEQVQAGGEGGGNG